MAERRLRLLALLERMSCKAKVYILSDIDQHGCWILPSRVDVSTSYDRCEGAAATTVSVLERRMVGVMNRCRQRN